MKLVIFTIITVIFMVLILPGILSFGIRNIPQNDQPSLDRSEKLYNEVVISQSFISTADNLSGIGLSIKNPNLNNKKDITLFIYGDDILLRTVTLNGATIADGKFVKFRFDPIAISENRQFKFVLTSPETSQQEAGENKALEIFLTNHQVDNALGLTIGEEVILGSNASFVAFYKPPYPTFVLENIYSNWIKNLVSDWQFFAFYTILILTLSGFLSWQFRLRKKTTE